MERRGGPVVTATGPGPTVPKRRLTDTVQIRAPRSSSPVARYAELPCVIEHAFSTIAWADFEESACARQDSGSVDSQVNESDADDHDFRDYALDLIPESPSTLEGSLSSSELLSFHGCVIPPLTPQTDLCPEKDGGEWRNINHSCDPQDKSQIVHRSQDQTDSLQDRKHLLQQLAHRAKHLASTLERLMTEPVSWTCDSILTSCKRQRLDDGYESQSCDSVEEMLRDVSTRCTAVLHSATASTAILHGTSTAHGEMVRMFGAFSGLQTCFLKEPSHSPEAIDSRSSFRTSIKEHCTIRTQTFAHGHAFTSRTLQGGHRFRWVPNHSI